MALYDHYRRKLESSFTRLEENPQDGFERTLESALTALQSTAQAVGIEVSGDESDSSSTSSEGAGESGF